jgi:hypothetical protein
MSVVRDTGAHLLSVDRPVSDVIATQVPAIDDYMVVAALGKVSLDSFICTVRISQKYREILLHDVIEALFDLRV